MTEVAQFNVLNSNIMEKARIADISRHRLSDGKGITTLVAFQGCLLHCRYCLNPDAMDFIWDAPVFTCMSLYETVKIDDLYFKATGGGITFGGGEPLLCSSFIREFKDICGIDWRLNVETSLNVSQKHLERLLDVVDYYIIDIKDMDTDRYSQYTGKDNRRVMDNLRFLLEHGKSDYILVRVPLIPHYNTITDVENNVRILKDMGVSHFDRLTYQVQAEVGGKLTELTGKLQNNYKSRKNGWWERFKNSLFADGQFT